MHMNVQGVSDVLFNYNVMYWSCMIPAQIVNIPTNFVCKNMVK